MLLLEKLHGRHHNLVNRCEISISQMTMDLLLFTYMFSVLYNCQYFDRTCLYIWAIRRVSCKKQEILALHDHLSSTPVFWWGLCCSIFIFILIYRTLLAYIFWFLLIVLSVLSFYVFWLVPLVSLNSWHMLSFKTLIC